MSKKIKEVNPGGVNGSGKGIVNTNSKDFKGLRNAIQQHAKNKSSLDKIQYELVSLKFQMESYIASKQPTSLIGVGDFLRKHLKAIKIKNKDFAKYIDMEESNLSSVISGRRKINIDLAFKLGHIFDMPPNLWLLIQGKNELLNVDRKKRLNYKKYRLEDLLKK